MSRPATPVELANNCFALSIIAAFGVPVFAAAAFAMATGRHGWAFLGFLALCLASAFGAAVEFGMGARYQQEADQQSLRPGSLAGPAAIPTKNDTSK